MTPPRLTRRRFVAGTASLVALASCSADDAAPTVSGSMIPTVTDPPATDPPATDPPAAIPTATNAPPATAAPPARYWPRRDDWETLSAADAGFSRDGLDAVAALAGGLDTTTLTVVSGGRLVAEEYFASADADTLQDVASVQKSLVSTLIGIAVDRGVLAVDDLVSQHIGPGWSRADPDDEAAITVWHCMTHSSGLRASTLRKVAEPGVEFDYNTPVYQKLRRVLEAATGASIDEVTRQWILDPIGAGPSARWYTRPTPPDPVGDLAWGLQLTARDMALFGVLCTRGGEWDGERVVPDGWFETAWTPSGVKPDYGLLWWLLGIGRLRGLVPEDTVAALGAGDQRIYVFPSFDIVVTRQGESAHEAGEAGSSFDRELIGALVDARL